MAASFQKDSFVGWTRFRHGDFQCTVVTDGPLRMGPVASASQKADPKEITELLTGAFLPADTMTLNQNLLIVNTAEGLVLFDTGCGVNQSFGKSSFGPDIGRAIWNMRAAGINPEDIDLVAITHAHPGPLLGIGGRRRESALPQCENRNQRHGLRLLDGFITHPRTSAHEGVLRRRTLQSLALP